jgi:hypothetical protein
LLLSNEVLFVVDFLQQSSSWQPGPAIIPRFVSGREAIVAEDRKPQPLHNTQQEPGKDAFTRVSGGQ